MCLKIHIFNFIKTSEFFSYCLPLRVNADPWENHFNCYIISTKQLFLHAWEKQVNDKNWGRGRERRFECRMMKNKKKKYENWPDCREKRVKMLMEIEIEWKRTRMNSSSSSDFSSSSSSSSIIDRFAQTSDMSSSSSSEDIEHANLFHRFDSIKPLIDKLYCDITHSSDKAECLHRNSFIVERQGRGRRFDKIVCVYVFVCLRLSCQSHSAICHCRTLCKLNKRRDFYLRIVRKIIIQHPVVIYNCEISRDWNLVVRKEK
jgi:hypothetical protein